VHGNPENNSGHITGGTYFTFYFVDKEEVIKRFNNEPTRITLNFQLEKTNNRRPFPKGGIKEWTKKETKEYGDMIIININVGGEN
jgi:hypothetical protein